MLNEKYQKALEQLQWIIKESNNTNDLEYHGVSVKDSIAVAIEVLNQKIEKS